MNSETKKSFQSDSEIHVPVYGHRFIDLSEFGPCREHFH